MSSHRYGVHEAGPQLGQVAGVTDAGAVAGGLPVVIPLCLAEVAPAAAVGDVAELGDIDVDQLPRPGALISTGRLTGHSVDMGEPVEPAAHQYRVDCRGRHAEAGTDLHRSEPLLPPEMDDLADHRLRGLGVLGVPGRGAVVHAGRAVLAVALGPLLSGAPRDVEELGRSSDWPSIIDDQARKPQTMARGQRSVSVGHEGLLACEAVPRQLHFTSGGLHPSTTSDRVVAPARPTCLDITASALQTPHEDMVLI